VNLIERAQRWIARDPDPDTRRELEQLVREQDIEALRERFSGPLQFGTAGLRGPLGAGPARMNRVTVARTTAGLCDWLLRQVPEAAERGLCVARDARLKSDVFMRDVIEVALGAGMRVRQFTGPVPTPVLAFATLKTGAAAGVMITASHNPPQYNGYKVFWENGAQIIAPNDRGIAEAIDAATSADQIPRIDLEQAAVQGPLELLDTLLDAYIDCISRGIHAPETTQPRVAYTALHGVGEAVVRRAFGHVGWTDFHSVRSQAEPDGRFPTVAFPNPEESGTTDRVLALAEQRGADLALANDPDADRLAASVLHDGRYEALSGNDIGILLADDLLSQYRGEARPFVLSTIVSSPMLAAVAKAHGAHWEQTLSGHKWIQNRALELTADGLAFVFGYEEALGYATTSCVRDKDGISAALCLTALCTRLKAEGKTLIDARSELWRAHGLYAERHTSQRFEGSRAADEMRERMQRCRSQPPKALAGLPVQQLIDLQARTRTTRGRTSPWTELPPSNLLIFELEGGHRAMLRPSGTEPKLKYYVYARTEVQAEEPLEAAVTRGETRVSDITDELVSFASD
jgi:phosphomannomutase